jgi:hypothetical protein
MSPLSAISGRGSLKLSYLLFPLPLTAARWLLLGHSSFSGVNLDLAVDRPFGGTCRPTDVQFLGRPASKRAIAAEPQPLGDRELRHDGIWHAT